MTGLRDDRGSSLIELLISTTIMVVLLLATLLAAESFGTLHHRDEERTAAQDTLRRSVDDLQRRLRDLAAPATAIPSIARATDSDLVFATAEPQRRWVRYCLDPSDPGVGTGRASLWLQTSVAAVAAPTATSCPAPVGWTSTTSVGQGVVNMRDGLRRPVFGYDWPTDAGGSAITGDTTTVSRITTALWVDTHPGRAPGETRLASGVFLRNQNRPPTAAFSATPNGHGVVLDGAASSDPDGRRLEYHWYAAPPASVPAGCRPASPAPATYLGTGVAPVVAFAVGTTSPQTVSLCVVDRGGLVATTAMPVAFS